MMSILIDRLRELPAIRALRERLPLLQVVGVTPERLTPAQRELMRRFREGIASALGVPPEAIREDVLERWIIEWTKAFVKPEYWAMRAELGYEFGRELGRLLAEAGVKVKAGAHY
jgi:hypothetical protein